MGKGLKKWLARLQNGDQSAFLPIYERTAPGILRFLLWKTRGDRPLSEDILQETYVKFLCHLDKLENIEELAVYSYLIRIAKHAWVDKVGRAPHAKREHVAMEDVVLADPVHNRQETAIELREVSIAMQSISEKDSDIIWLRDGLGLSHKEVADTVGITEQASRQAYVRAKKSLLAQFGDAVLPAGDLSYA